jgi:ArsR family transcriptional regulator
MRKLTRFFKALSDETRLRILNVIMERECCVCEVEQALQISPTRASRNLTTLYDAGFIKARRDGLWVLYSIDSENLVKRCPYLLKNIREEMGENALARQDLIRLASASRIGSCAQKTLSSTSSN